MRSRSFGALRQALLALLLIVPLPFGAGVPWASPLLPLAVSLLLLVAGFSLWRRSTAASLPLGGLRWAAALYGAACLYGIVQAIPGMPEGIASAHWHLADEVIGGAAFDSISIMPDATLTSVVRLLSYAAVFWLTALAFAGRSDADKAMLTIAVATGLCASIGMALHVTGSATLVWFERPARPDVVTGTFVSRNHFATYAGLGLLAALASLARIFGIGRGNGSMEANDIAYRGLRAGPRLWLVSAVVLMNLSALLLSQSRAGIMLSIMTLVLFLAGIALRSMQRRVVTTALALIVGVPAGLFIVLSGGGVLDRIALLLDPQVAEVRIPAFRLALDAILDRPWLGFGLGTFPDVYGLYRAPPLDLHLETAHSSYLELALELGLPATVALCAATGLVAAGCLSGAFRGRDVAVLPWAAFCATVLVGLHALVDSSLQLPAVAVTYAAMLGVGWRRAAQRLTSRTAPPPSSGHAE